MDLTEQQWRAMDLADDFRNHTAGVWLNLNREDIAAGLEARIVDASKISSRGSSLCGPAATIYPIAKTDPEAYAKAVISLYDTGKARLRNLSIEPSASFRAGVLPSGNDAVDWLMLGSLRDSSNWITTYKGTGNWLYDGIDDAKAATIPSTVVGWMKNFGYTDIQNETNLVLTKDWDNLVEANHLFDRKYLVSLFIDFSVLKTNRQTDFSATANHWVVMASKASSSAIHADPNSRFSMQVYSWGAVQSVPENSAFPIHPKAFLNYYYGYVAGKP